MGNIKKVLTKFFLETERVLLPNTVNTLLYNGEGLEGNGVKGPLHYGPKYEIVIMV